MISGHAGPSAFQIETSPRLFRVGSVGSGLELQIFRVTNFASLGGLVSPVLILVR
jgi:hypothetical protein